MPSYYCPITAELMEDPVIDNEGNTYERNAILAWLVVNSTSPITRQYLSVADLKPNRALRESISYAHEQRINSFWNRSLCGKTIEITNRGVITKTNGLICYDSAVLGMQAGSYKVQILNRLNGFAMIGLAPLACDPNGFGIAGGYYINLSSGGLFSDSDADLNRHYAPPLENGCIVEVLLENNQISFIIGGRNRGVAFDNVLNTDLYPSIAISEVGISFRAVV